MPGEHRSLTNADVTGIITSDVVFVGESPGPEEEKKGRPFIGQAGKLHDAMCLEAGLTEFYITNVSKQYPGKDEHHKIKAPSAGEKDYWKPVLEWELDVVKPKHVVLLGKHACKLAFPGVWKMHDIVGSKVEKDGVFYYAAWHPASFLYNQGTVSNTRNMNTQRRLLKEIVRGDEKVSYRYSVLSPRENQNTVVIDCETNDDTDPRTAQITEWSQLDMRDNEALLCFDRSVLPERPRSVIFHNAMFDYPLLARQDPGWLKVWDIHDTMIMAYVLGFEDLSLKGLCADLFGDKVFTYQQRGECGPEIYNAQDVFLTRKLFEYLSQYLDGTAYGIDRSLVPLLTRAVLNGGYEIDQKLLASAINEREAEKSQIESLFNSWFPGVNLASPAQLLSILPTRDAKAETLRNLGTTEAEAILQWRHAAKSLSTYLRPLVGAERLSGLFRLTLSGGEDRGDSSDGGGASTGRLSSYRHNLQNLNPDLQRCLRAPRGYKLLRADYSQIELRCMAEISGDTELTKALREPGGDVHQQTADLTGLPRSGAGNTAKTWNFNRWYWGAALADPEQVRQIAKSFAGKYGKTEEECHDILVKQNEMYPGFTQWCSYQWELVKASGYSTSPSPFRHRRKIHLTNPAKAMRQAGNHPPQSMAVYIVKEAMRELGWHEDRQFVNQVHDEIQYFVPTKDVKKHEKIVRECMLEVGNKYLPSTGVDVTINTSKYWDKKA